MTGVALDIAGRLTAMPRVYLIGPGAMGAALAAALVRASVPVSGLHGRNEFTTRRVADALGVPFFIGALPNEAITSDVIVVAVRDTDVPALVEQIAQLPPACSQTVLHLSGAWPARTLLGALAPARAVGTMHPLWSTPGGGLAALPQGCSFGIEGDAKACATAELIVRALGGRALALTAEMMPLYHAAAVFSANALVALVDVGRRLLVQAGIPSDEAVAALSPLVSSVAENLCTLGLPAALTGPVARADAATVERHLAAVCAFAPSMADLYRRLGLEILAVARARDPDLPPEAIGRMLELFSGHE